MKRGLALPGALALSSVFCAACASTAATPPPALAPAPTLFTGTRFVDHLNVVPDEVLTRTLVQELERQPPEVDTRDLGVSTVDGVVTLQGSVPNRLAAQRAVAIAHVVRGVRAVVDRISVSPVHRADYELEFELASRLARDGAISSLPIAAKAHDGIVRLTGDVDSGAAQRIALADVLATPGVRDVAEDLAVVPPIPGERSDDTLEKEAARTLRDDPWLDDAHIAVTAEHGRLALRGWAGSAAERSRAEQDARTAAPDGVDARALRVDRWTDDGTLRADPSTARPDRDVAQALADCYVRDPRVHPFVPDADVRSGVVVLTGVAPNRQAAAAAVQDARNVTGVVDVRDDLQTRSVATATDAIVQRDVESAMSHDPRLVSRHLRVHVVAGRVTLSGAVGSEQDRFDAIGVASTIPGVREVDDQIALEPLLPPAHDEAVGRAEAQPSR